MQPCSGHTQPPSAEQDARLTPRQKQILALLKAGKVNKEIALELGVGLGTVKQHMVALFKRLNVTNRVMAVSRAYALSDRAADSAETGASSHLEWRPVTVLALSLGERAPDGGADADAHGRGWQALHTVAAGVAYDFDGVMVARPSGGVDIFFGIQCVRETDALRAIRATAAVADRLKVTLPGTERSLRAGVVSGMLAASMGRRGGWTGEAVAGPAIVAARTLAISAAPGCLRAASSTLTLAAFARRSSPPVAAGDEVVSLEIVTLHALAALWKSSPPPTVLVGRKAEVEALESCLLGLRRAQGAAVLISGEIGMGKTSLARWLGAQGTAAGITGLSFRCQPMEWDKTESVSSGPSANDVRHVEDLLEHGPVLVTVDDAHRASPEAMDAVRRLSDAAATRPLLLVVLERPNGPSLHHMGRPRSFKLGRLTSDDILALVRRLDKQTLLTEERLMAVVQLAKGIPLFAVELLRHAQRRRWLTGADGRSVPLTLASLVTGRLDGLGVDRELLRAIAPRGRLALSDVRAQRWFSAKDLDHAVAMGVLAVSSDDQATVSFTHPLIRMVIREQIVVSNNRGFFMTDGR